jgi:UDP-2,3-diacylglucosamine pyrophosphatase LpxH
LTKNNSIRNRQIMKRKIDIAVISDVHLGTRGCHAAELLNYLKSIKPNTLILNGDIIDMWQFNKSYFPKEHIKILNRIMKMAVQDTKVYYITGNHDDALRNFTDFSLGNLHVRDSLTLQLGGQRCWFFHGDVFDTSVIRFRWLSILGGKGYDLLVRLNKTVNYVLKMFKYEKIAFSKVIKMRVKEAVKFINDFETQAINAGRAKGYNTVVCGHVHTPQQRTEGGVLYLNSGDWIENLTALEYTDGEWTMHHYNESDYDTPNATLGVSILNSDLDEEDALENLPQAAFLAQFFDKKSLTPQISFLNNQLTPVKQ